MVVRGEVVGAVMRVGGQAYGAQRLIGQMVGVTGKVGGGGGATLCTERYWD